MSKLLSSFLISGKIISSILIVLETTISPSINNFFILFCVLLLIFLVLNSDKYKYLTASDLLKSLLSCFPSFKVDQACSPFIAIISGLGNFLFDIVSLPINTAVNFVKDLFSFGNPDEPFSLKTFLFGGDGERGLIGKMVDMITDIFKLPEGGILKGIADKIFSIARLVKAIGLAGVAAAGALTPGGKSPGEAFKEKFAEVMSGGSGSEVTNEGDIVKTIEGDTSETTNKTEQLNETTNNNQGNITYVDNSNKQNQNIANSKNETYTGPLNTGIDPYHDRLSLYGIG